MAFINVLGRQWATTRTPKDLADQAARVAANNARGFKFPQATARELKREKARADADTD